MQVRLLALLVAVGAVVAMNGCGGLTDPGAQFENKDSTIAVYAVNGTPVTFPSALQLRFYTRVPVNASFGFDLAFDLNSVNDVVVYSVKSLANQLAGAHRVGMQTTTTSFDAATSAPTSGYVYDTSMVLPLGRTMFVDVIDPSACSPYSLRGQTIRAKLVVDSIAVPSRKIFLHVLTNQNCGFNSLAIGLPQD